MRRALLVLAVLSAGCTAPGWPGGDGAGLVDVGPPQAGGGFAACASSAAQTVAFPMRAETVTDAGGLEPGIHRESERSFVWVWASYENTTRQDRVSRLNAVELKREPDGTHVLCTRVEILAPTMADGELRSYDVAVRFQGESAFPEREMRVVVNWVAGCACDPIPRGNTTAYFPATVVPETK